MLRSPAARSPALPLGLLGVVLLLDLALQHLPGSVPLVGAFDEPAHLATAAIALLALAGRPALARSPAAALTALLCACAIDVDHVPLYLGVPHIADGGRPYSHSLATIVLLLALAAAVARGRQLLCAAAAGVALHLLRDLGTGPGVALAWPWSVDGVRVPYGVYAAVLTALAVTAAARALTDRRTPGRRHPVRLEPDGVAQER